MILRGVAASGLGKATALTQIPWVVSQIEEKLGMRLYPGTFNVRLLGEDEIGRWEKLKKQPGIPLEEPGSSTCAAVCYQAVINGRVPAAVLVPGVTAYPSDQVELIAAEAVRLALDVDDGDEVSLLVMERTHAQR